jgi:hypothetical protein
MKGSGGRPALDDIGADFVGGDLLEIGSAVRIGGKPAFGRRSVPSEMQEFRAVAEVPKDAEHADRGTFDYLETKVVFVGPGAPDRDDDNAALAETPSCKVKQAGEL